MMEKSGHISRMLSSYDMCGRPNSFSLFESAFRSFFAILATHILAGEVDTTLDQGNLLHKISWMFRYFNPVNLCWRYYSILAYRFMASTWTKQQLALVNFEAHPYLAPIPYVVGENIKGYEVKRLEISGVISSQGLLSIIAAYQGILAVQFTLSTQSTGFLPTISKPIAILGLFRVMVSNWIASKVYVDPFPYPTEAAKVDYKSNKAVTCFWITVLVGLVLLSFWPFIGYPEFNVRKYYMELSMEVLYQYMALSLFLFHVVLLSHGPKGLGNRVACFDHWIYKLQTLGLVLIMTGTVVIGIVDFVWHDYYRHCE